MPVSPLAWQPRPLTHGAAMPNFCAAYRIGRIPPEILFPVLSVGCYGRCPDEKSCVCARNCLGCLRSFGAPHPLRLEDESLRLPNRRGRGGFCDICHCTVNWKRKGVQGAVAEVKNNPDENVEHRCDVAEYEEQKFKDDGTPVKRINTPTKSVSYAGSVVKAVAEGGRLWPTALWTSFFKEAVPEGRVQRVPITNVGVVEGIIECPSRGTAIGTYLIQSEHFQGQMLERTGASTEDDSGLTARDVQRHHEQMSRQVSIGTEEVHIRDASSGSVEKVSMLKLPSKDIS